MGLLQLTREALVTFEFTKSINMDISKAIPLIRPSAQWSLNGDTLDGLTWIGPGEPPTLEELRVAWANRPPEPQPDVQMWQVKVWMVRNGIDLGSIPGIMAASIPAGPQLQEALVRWETAPLVPFDNALVGLIAGALKVSKETAWAEIRAI